MVCPVTICTDTWVVDGKPHMGWPMLWPFVIGRFHANGMYGKCCAEVWLMLWPHSCVD